MSLQLISQRTLDLGIEPKWCNMEKNVLIGTFLFSWSLIVLVSAVLDDDDDDDVKSVNNNDVNINPCGVFWHENLELKSNSAREKETTTRPELGLVWFRKRLSALITKSPAIIRTHLRWKEALSCQNNYQSILYLPKKEASSFLEKHKYWRSSAITCVISNIISEKVICVVLSSAN